MFAAVHASSGEDGLEELARSFSPHIEMTSADTVTFDIGGLRRLLGGPHQIASEIAHRANERGVAGNIGIAATAETAILASRSLPGVTVIAPGEEARHFDGLRIEVLPTTDEMRMLLHRWGIRTLGEFCALPESGVLERLGAEGRRLLRIARGDGDRPLRSAPIPTGYLERLELDYPVQLLEPLLFLISRLMHELCDRLRTHARATTEVHLVLELEGGTEHPRSMQLPFATHDAKTLLKLVQLDLERHPPGTAVSAIRLRLVPVDPRRVQNNLYSPPAPQPEKLELTLGKIRAMVGVANAGFPEVLNTHRPDAWRMRMSAPSSKLSVEAPPSPRIAFRYYRPAREALVEMRSGRPQRMKSSNAVLTVERAAGPWRLSGDWWSAECYVREEWDIEASDDVLYRIYLARQKWFVEGIYD